jgi:ketosteroid isomerase-like protein
MSVANVRLVEEIYGLFDGREVDTAFRHYLAPGFEIRTPEGYPEGRQVFRGREGLEDWLATIDEVWSDWHYEDHRFVPAGDAVVAIVRAVAEGTASGVRLDLVVGHVWRIRDGRATGVRVYRDVEMALEAAGLPSSGTTGGS